ncbi:MAG: hypothetical protein IJQ76_11380 [Prevotella sp.]|nr:hypothetical protein [Prevotella sp.]MBR0276784.1 hypothetical protein [Prevotella sp.]
MKKKYLLPAIAIHPIAAGNLLVVLSGEPKDNVVAGARRRRYEGLEEETDEGEEEEEF